MSNTPVRPWRIAAPVLALGATMAHLTAGATPQGALAKYQIQLKFEKISGSHGGPESCPGAKRNGSDVLTGTVEGDETASRDGITYTGNLSRTTNLEYCENWRPNGSEDQFCVPVLTGKQARVVTTINVYPPATNQDVEIKYKPIILVDRLRQRQRGVHGGHGARRSSRSIWNRKGSLSSRATSRRFRV